DDRVGYSETGVRDPVEQQHYNAFANDPLVGGGAAPPPPPPPPPTVDRTPPTSPTGLRATPGTRQVTLTWTAATDNVGVDRYYLFRGNSKYRLLGNVTSYTDTGLTTGTRYVYKVYAIDAAGNWSGSSGNVAATAG
ncbi:MAG: fibronectin type III domain-containing protein, partial [Marmoricola sp.]